MALYAAGRNWNRPLWLHWRAGFLGAHARRRSILKLELVAGAACSWHPSVGAPPPCRTVRYIRETIAAAVAPSPGIKARVHVTSTKAASSRANARLARRTDPPSLSPRQSILTAARPIAGSLPGIPSRAHESTERNAPRGPTRCSGARRWPCRGPPCW